RAVLQHPCRRLIGRGDPDTADDRESRRDGRTDRTQFRDTSLWITKKRLAGEIEIHMPCHRAIPHCRRATRSRWCATVKPQGCHFRSSPPSSSCDRRLGGAAHTGGVPWVWNDSIVFNPQAWP